MSITDTERKVIQFIWTRMFQIIKNDRTNYHDNPWLNLGLYLRMESASSNIRLCDDWLIIEK